MTVQDNIFKSVHEQLKNIELHCSHYKPKVVIWTLVYNHEPYLRDYFEGIVKQQTKFNFIAVVHEDVSTDNSAQIINEYAEKYPNIIQPIYEIDNQYSKRDGTLELIMNAAIEASGAEYVALCEGDDYWTDPHKLQKQVDFLDKNPDYSLCYTDVDFYEPHINRTIKNIFTTNYIPRYCSFEQLLTHKGYIAPCSWLVKKVFFRGELSHPLDFTFDVALHNYANGNVGYIPECTATYRVLEHSASHLSDPRAIFIRNKGLYETQLHYINTYPEHFTVKQKHHIQSIALRGLLLSAWYFNDTALKHEIREFYSKSLKYNLLMMALDIPFIKHFIPLYRKLRLKK